MRAEVISIGTELLLGEITDTNAVHIAQQLRDIGLDLLYKTTVGDNQGRIATAVEHALRRVDIVITTGGLGPTVDDVTREGIAEATDRELEFHQELQEQIAERFKRFGSQMSENNRRQAWTPSGATPIENPVGTAPIFILETEDGVVITLPGVPREMKHLLETEVLPWLAERIGKPSVIHSLILRTAGIGESQIDNRIGDLMTASNPTVGLAAHAGQTDIRITAKAATREEAISLINPIADTLRQRLGNWIYGEGKLPLEDAVADLLEAQSTSVSTLEMDSQGLLAQRLEAVGAEFKNTAVESLHELPTLGIELGESLNNAALSAARTLRARYSSDYALAILVNNEADLLPSGTAIAVIGPNEEYDRAFRWNRSRADVHVWASTHALATLRRMLLEHADD